MAKKDNSELYLFSDTATAAGEALLTEHKEEQAFYSMPTSPASNLAMVVFTHGKEQLGELPERMELARNKNTYTLTASDTARQITQQQSNGDLITLELSDIDKLKGTNKTISKLFAFSLVKLNEQAEQGGQLTRNTIEFSLQELVDRGFYSNTVNARAGVKKAFEVLTNMKVSGTIAKGKKKNIEQAELAVLFTYCRIKKNVVTVDLNSRINWEMLTQFYTILPKWAFSLPVKPWDLLYYVFYLARQNLDKISKQGYFTISFQAIHSRLVLPEAEYTKNPQRDIKDVIEKAITEIEERAHTPELQFIPRYNEKDNIKEYLSNGYLEVHFSGAYAAAFLDLYKRNTKRLEQAEKKREQIIEKAKVKNLAKQMEAEAAKEQAETSTEPEPLTV
ncbi:MAG: hypothetical protein K5979_15285 [Ruminococcus sp.]|nr:hypothetical protein [Ruminococcus sp.]